MAKKKVKNRMKTFIKNGRSPKKKMVDDLKEIKMEDNLKFLLNGRWHQKIGRQPKKNGRWPKKKLEDNLNKMEDDIKKIGRQLKKNGRWPTKKNGRRPKKNGIQPQFF